MNPAGAGGLKIDLTFAFYSPMIAPLENTGPPDEREQARLWEAVLSRGQPMAAEPVSMTTDLPTNRGEAPHRLAWGEARRLSPASSLAPQPEIVSAQPQPCLAGRQPWRLPERGLALYHGPGETARLSHYFLPRLVAAGKNVLMLDGANAADPRLLERLARQRGVAFGEFSRRIRIARAFTCFQLTELVARVPRFLADFPAQALIVTAFPDLYFDEDIRDWDARVAFERALGDLRRWAGGWRGEGPRLIGAESTQPQKYKKIVETPSTAGLRFDFAHRPEPTEGKPCPSGGALEPATRSLAIAIFSSAADFSPSPARRQFFARAAAVAGEVLRFRLGEDGRPKLFLERGAALICRGEATPRPYGLPGRVRDHAR